MAIVDGPNVDYSAVRPVGQLRFGEGTLEPCQISQRPMLPSGTVPWQPLPLAVGQTNLPQFKGATRGF